MGSLIAFIVLIAVASAQLYYYYPQQYYVPVYATAVASNNQSAGQLSQSQPQVQYSPDYGNGNHVASYPQSSPYDPQQVPSSGQQVYRDQSGQQTAQKQIVQPLYYYYSYPNYYVLGK
ncbi:hypothetical protein QR680_012486 [Steinernema hermaphroditum]|uniref:Uncharacterized protein n=1 Tax=Steinernema hermaphroditum TaxID=289476 RepID=A0AA39I3S1_9BILA|nr:hypothetical protein QR680_012486 [Steinernema hermaphroditum]